MENGIGVHETDSDDVSGTGVCIHGSRKYSIAGADRVCDH